MICDKPDEYPYLVAYVFSEVSNNGNLIPQVTRVSKGFSFDPEDTTYPSRTVFFFFGKSPIKNADDLKMTFCCIKLGNVLLINSDEKIQVTSPYYFVGYKQKAPDGSDAIFNPHCNLSVYTATLPEGYQVVDP